jgi:hypothetical protein
MCVAAILCGLIPDDSRWLGNFSAAHTVLREDITAIKAAEKLTRRFIFG